MKAIWIIMSSLSTVLTGNVIASVVNGVNSDGTSNSQLECSKSWVLVFTKGSTEFPHSFYKKDFNHPITGMEYKDMLEVIKNYKNFSIPSTCEVCDGYKCLLPIGIEFKIKYGEDHNNTFSDNKGEPVIFCIVEKKNGKFVCKRKSDSK